MVYPLPASDDAEAAAAAESKLSERRAQLHRRLGRNGSLPNTRRRQHCLFLGLPCSAMADFVLNMIHTTICRTAANKRTPLCRLAGLPSDRPLLRLANALPLAPTAVKEGGDASSASGRLSDVHAGLPPSGVAGSSVHLISGCYDYHHYMQVGWKLWMCRLMLQRIILQNLLQLLAAVDVCSSRDIVGAPRQLLHLAAG